jgi:hypothetical protein
MRLDVRAAIIAAGALVPLVPIVTILPVMFISYM